MKLSTRGTYAVSAMVGLASRQEGSVCLLKDLAAEQNVSLSYLEQLMSKLNRQGLVVSVRGKKGGCRLARDAGTIRILDIIEAVGEEFRVTRCEKQEGHGCLADSKRCLTHHFWVGLESHIKDYLANVTLADLFKRRTSIDTPSV